ncbi:unnamed protein product [Arabidopsis thaliana]|uniref:Uncharacterized protein n=2 Tax=Arabidopsis thaliana TaxID=3702 RepID=A0A654FM54_ARATH|nr:uncharacterized protein AT4G05631 [Arabidopsis thaliana]AEE82541.1 hypothetical protein AT4G05631 [Arabidopsis thaliana]VYS61909.1 unnamed protein product [Arabidopsis thaliana]|eukprot:NP_680610.1 hypothetical protein AT4G05631 [Arabidopsis thaliana]
MDQLVIETSRHEDSRIKKWYIQVSVRISANKKGWCFVRWFQETSVMVEEIQYKGVKSQIESFSRSKLLKSKETVGVATKWKELWIYQVIRFIQSSAQGFMIENYRDSDKEAVRSASGALELRSFSVILSTKTRSEYTGFSTHQSFENGMLDGSSDIGDGKRQVQGLAKNLSAVHSPQGFKSVGLKGFADSEGFRTRLSKKSCIGSFPFSVKIGVVKVRASLKGSKEQLRGSLQNETDKRSVTTRLRKSTRDVSLELEVERVTGFVLVSERKLESDCNPVSDCNGHLYELEFEL